MTPTVSPQKQAALARAMRKKINDIESVFKQLDTDGSGRISLAEFIQAMRKLGLKLSDEESGNLMHRFVHSSTGKYPVLVCVDPIGLSVRLAPVRSTPCLRTVSHVYWLLCRRDGA